MYLCSRCPDPSTHTSSQYAIKRPAHRSKITMVSLSPTCNQDLQILLILTVCFFFFACLLLCGITILFKMSKRPADRTRKRGSIYVHLQHRKSTCWKNWTAVNHLKEYGTRTTTRYDLKKQEEKLLKVRAESELRVKKNRKTWH